MSRLRAFGQLMRLPNTPSALADIGLGTLAVLSREDGLPPPSWLAVVLTGLASLGLYTSGMVWNDFFDVEQDRRERPERPIPSGKVSRRAAGLFAAALMTVGVLFALLASLVLGRREVVYVALGIVAGVLLYDGWLKRTWAGPVAMGGCRLGNVLLGVAGAGRPLDAQALHLAIIVGIYVAGITWFARTEAQESRQGHLLGAAAIMLAGLLLALPLPLFLYRGQQTSWLFLYLLVGLGFFVGLPASQAIAAPKPSLVQRAVKTALFGLVLLDAVLATALVGPLGLVLLVLAVPSLYLSRLRWLYAT
jgi:4-hydroxybenzoate polyprenyltransferase